jgi:hypothetical protein
VQPLEVFAAFGSWQFLVERVDVSPDGADIPLRRLTLLAPTLSRRS